MRARTVARPVRLRGRGLFSRVPVRLCARPAPAGTGLLFSFSGRPSLNKLSAGILNARAGGHCTTVARGRLRVRVVEHLLAACAGLGITDLTLECPNGEPPFGDGSCRHFTRAFIRAGFRDVAGPSRLLALREPVLVTSGDGFAFARPARGLHVTCVTDFPWEGLQRQDWVRDPGRFERELAGARTVAYTDVRPDRLRNALGLRFALRRRGGFVVPACPRLPAETCRHKLVDLIGDLALLGGRLAAEVFAFRPGHRLNLKLARRLADQSFDRGEQKGESPGCWN